MIMHNRPKRVPILVGAPPFLKIAFRVMQKAIFFFFFFINQPTQPPCTRNPNFRGNRCLTLTRGGRMQSGQPHTTLTIGVAACNPNHRGNI